MPRRCGSTRRRWNRQPSQASRNGSTGRLSGGPAVEDEPGATCSALAKRGALRAPHPAPSATRVTSALFPTPQSGLGQPFAVDFASVGAAIFAPSAKGADSGRAAAFSRPTQTRESLRNRSLRGMIPTRMRREKMNRLTRVQRGRPLRCPQCGGTLDLDQLSPRDLRGFLCPACHAALEAHVPHAWIPHALWLLCSALAAWAAGFRGTAFALAAAIAALVLLLPAHFFAGLALGPLLPPGVKLHAAPKGSPRAHYLTLDICRGRTTGRADKPAATPPESQARRK